MKSLNGLLFIIIGGAIIWIGATGRFPALAAALGMIKAAPGTQPKAQPNVLPQTQFPAMQTPTVGSTNMLTQPQSVVWQDALRSLGLANAPQGAQ